MKLPLPHSHGIRNTISRKMRNFKLPRLFLMLLLMGALSAEASHYRYGTISWQRVPGSCEIEVTVKQAWRRTFYSPLPVVGGTVTTTTLHLRNLGGVSLTSESIDLLVTSVNVGDDWFFGEYTTTISLPSCDSTYRLDFDNCCRISTLSNNADFNFGSVSIVTPYNDGNDSPVSSQTPIVNLAAGNPAAMFPLSGVDPNGDPLTFRVATAAEASGSFPQGSSHPDFSVATNGMATFNTVGKAVGNQYNVWYAIEDGEGALILGDFLIEIVDSGLSLPPAFDFSVTPTTPPCITVNPGNLVTFTIKADDPDPDDSVYISAVGVPGGATHSPAIPTNPNKPDSTVFSWTPGPGDIGTTIITYTAEDDGGLQTSTSICIQVTADSIADTTCVVPDSITVVSDGTWMKSTVTTASNLSGIWGGVGGVLPGDGTFTLPAPIGQPYPFPSIHEVDGAEVIKAGSNITYYRKEFTLSGDDEVAARLRINMDDHVEIYVNGFLVAGKYSGSTVNFRGPAHDVFIMADGTVINPNGGGDAFDFVTASTLSDIFSAGTNSITVALRNYNKASDGGGFSLRMDVDYSYTTGACEVLDSCVSDSSWMLSTVVTTATANSYPWPGVASVPAEATFTLPVEIGQPYPWNHLYIVPGSEVIKSASGVTYYMKKFELTDHVGINSRFRMFVDDNMQIFINGHSIAMEESMGPISWRTANHDILFKDDGTVDNGHMGGDPFDHYTGGDMDTILQTGENTLILAIRNRTTKPDKGGFSFRMDMDKGGVSVIKKSSSPASMATEPSSVLVQAYPNPTKNWVNVVIDQNTIKAGGQVVVMDLNGRVLENLDILTSEVQVDLEKYAAGIYLLRIDTDEKSHTLKIFKH